MKTVRMIQSVAGKLRAREENMKRQHQQDIVRKHHRYPCKRLRWITDKVEKYFGSATRATGIFKSIIIVAHHKQILNVIPVFHTMETNETVKALPNMWFER